METKFKSLPQLINHFKNEATCIEYLEQQRWNGKPTCPHCNHDKVYKTDRGYKCASKDCKKKFTVTVGTVFQSSKIKLHIWFSAVYLATAHKKGISSLQLHRDLGITQKTAWFMLHRIRAMMKAKNPALLTGTTQADESFFGGKNKNRHADKKVKESQGRSVKDKTPVFGMVNKGQVNTEVVPDTKAKTLKPIIEKMVEQGAIMVTDEWNGYNGLSKDYQHEVIKHKSGEYVRNNYHTNSIEGFWSLMKRGIFGIYHSASPKHLHRYCDEFQYRYNTRKVLDTDRFTLSLGKVNGRLTYKAYVYTSVHQKHTTDKIKPLNEIPKQYYDEKGMLVVDNFVPSDYYKPFAISVNPIKNGILNSGYKLLQSMYNPYVNGKRKFTRTIIVKELNAKGKPNIAFDNTKFEEAKIKKTGQGSLFDN